MSSEEVVVSADAEEGERRENENGFRRDMSGRVEEEEWALLNVWLLGS